MAKKTHGSKTQQDLSLPPQDHYLRNAFENMLEGFQIIGRDWTYLYINEVGAGHGERTADELLGRTMMEAFPDIEKTTLFRTLKTCMTKGIPRTLTNEFAYADGHTRWFELRINPVPDGLSILSLDITERKLAEAKVERLTQTLTLLSNVNQSIVRIRDLDVLLKKVCQIAVEDGRLSLVWIGLLDEVEQKIQIVAKAGKSFGYLDKLDLHVGNPPVKNCPVDAALRTGQHNVCHLANLSSGESAPCQQAALENGFLSSASFPLYVNSEIRGSINLYSNDPDFFDREKVRLLRDMSLNIGFAMEVSEDQEALVENTSRLENAEIYARLGSWEYNVRTGRGSWSKGLYRMFGLKARNGAPSLEEYLDLVHPEDRCIIEELTQKMARGEVPTLREFRTNPEHGPVRYFQPTVTVMRDPESGEPIKFIGTQIDITEHVLDQMVLRESEERLRTVTENAPDIITELDHEGRIQFMSRVLPGFKMEDVLGRPFYEWVDPEFHEVMRTALKKVFTEGIRQSYESHGAGKDGEKRWYLSSISPVKVGEQVKDAILIASDITERKLAEQAIQDSEIRYRSLFEDSPISLWEEDFSEVQIRLNALREQGVTDFAAYFHEHVDFVYECARLVRITDVNRATLKMYNALDKMNFLTNLQEVFKNEPIQQFQKELIMIAEGKTVFRWEGINYTLEGKLLNINLQWAVVPGHEQDLKKVLVSIVDITDQKQTEDALRASEEKLRTVFSTMEEGMALNELIYGEDGQIIDYRILEVNPAYERFSGLSREQVVGRLATNIYGMSSSYIRSFWVQHLQDEHIVSETYNDGMQEWWRISTSKPADGKFVTVFFDVTEQKNVENALRQSERNYRTLVEQIPAIVYIDEIEDGKDRSVFISPQLETIMGAKVEEWMQMGVQAWIDHQHPEDRAYVNSMYKDFIHDGGVYDCKYRMVRDDGRIVWFHDKAVIIEASENGRVRQAHGVIYDVTQQKQVDAELRQRLKELETLHTISAALRTVQSLGEALPRLLDETLANLETDAGEIMLYDPVSNDLYVAVVRGWHAQLNPVSIRPGEGVAGHVFLSGKMYYSKELSQDPLALPSARERIPTGWNGVCLPIRKGKDVVGVWYVSMRLPQQFSPEQLRLLESLAEMAGAAIHRIRLHEETVQRLENLQALHEVDLAINANFDLRPTLDIVIEHAIHQLKVDAVDILLLRKGLQTLEYVAGQGFRTPINKGASVRIGESFAGRAALEHRILYVDNPNEVQKNHLFNTFWKSEGFSSCYCVPLIAKGEVKGVMEVFKRGPMLNDTEWMYYLETLSGQAAIAIDNTQLFENLQQANLELGVAYETTIEGWSRALELRDHETEGHTQRVTAITVELASHFKFSQADLLAIRRGAILHDIGKISVPDSILRKTGPLTEAEWSSVRRHPQVAYEMLKPIYYLRDSLDIPFCHHEKWDGTGYPRGLAGENIPLAARIFAVADVYDALSTARPYREAWPKQEVLEYIRESSGTHFDPQVVEVFLRLFSNDL